MRKLTNSVPHSQFGFDGLLRVVSSAAEDTQVADQCLRDSSTRLALDENTVLAEKNGPKHKRTGKTIFRMKVYENFMMAAKLAQTALLCVLYWPHFDLRVISPIIKPTFSALFSPTDALRGKQSFHFTFCFFLFFAFRRE